MAVKTKQTKATEDKFFFALRSGLSISNAARAANVNRRTVYKWRDDDEHFAAEWDDALEEGTDLLEDEAVRRAYAGIEEPVGFFQGRSETMVKRYSDNLLMFVLKGRRPLKWKENISPDGGGNSINITYNVPDKPDDN